MPLTGEEAKQAIILCLPGFIEQEIKNGNFDKWMSEERRTEQKRKNQEEKKKREEQERREQEEKKKREEQNLQQNLQEQRVLNKLAMLPWAFEEEVRQSYGTEASPMERWCLLRYFGRHIDVSEIACEKCRNCSFWCTCHFTNI